MGYIYHDRMSVIKNNEISPFVATQRAPEGVMLSEISQRRTEIV